jgi:predicted phosphodiesterase
MDKDAIAVFSDAHSNLEALEAVVDDMDAMGIKRRVCLGDTVGYGANPAKCLELVRAMGCPVLKGNHDEAAASDQPLPGMNGAATAGIEFSRGKLTDEQKCYLASLALVLKQWDCEFVHASIDDPGDWNYVFTELHAAEHFSRQSADICFCGHTHRPMLWEFTKKHFVRGTVGGGWIPLDEEGQVLINVGSVGQPRDHSPDACYVIYDPSERSVDFRRIPYDVAKARRKILRAKLPRFLANRLELGR